MSERTPAKNSGQPRELARLVEGPAPGLLRQSWALIRSERKWFLLPILLALLLIGGFVVLGGTGAAPLLYTLF